MSRNILFWYYIFCKRLFKKVSFLVILLLIPILTFLMTTSANAKDSAFVTVALSAENMEDKTTTEILNSLDKDSNLVQVTVCENKQEALSLVEYGQAHTAWIVKDNIQSKILQVAQGDKVELVDVYESKDNILVKAVREKIFQAVYPNISYQIYKNALEELTADDVDEETLRKNYNLFNKEDSFVEIKFLDNGKVFDSSQVNYLTSPLRGLLVLLILICGFAGVMYFKKDEKDGAYYTLNNFQHYMVFTCNNFSAISISAVFVFIALFFTGTYTDFWNEFLWMILYILSVTAFCNLIGSLVNSQNILSLFLPALIVLCVAMCPVFFNVRRFGVLSFIMPPHYYLYGINSNAYLVGVIVYILTFFILSYVLFYYKKSKYYNKFQ